MIEAPTCCALSVMADVLVSYQCMRAGKRISAVRLAALLAEQLNDAGYPLAGIEDGDLTVCLTSELATLLPD